MEVRNVTMPHSHMNICLELMVAKRGTVGLLQGSDPLQVIQHQTDLVPIIIHMYIKLLRATRVGPVGWKLYKYGTHIGNYKTKTKW